jgi:hypothetical protein
MRAEVDVQAVALDTACPLAVGQRVQKIKPIQGALDPLLLRVGGKALDARVDQLMEAWERRSMDLQSRPRHPARRADRPCRTGPETDRRPIMATLSRGGAGQAGRRIAVVLFNLGGPDDAASVKPFLFNLFNDPAIIGLPGFLRSRVAKLISSRREASAQANYAMMDAGGGSPLLAETREAGLGAGSRAGLKRCPETRSRSSSPCATGIR